MNGGVWLVTTTNCRHVPLSPQTCISPNSHWHLHALDARRLSGMPPSQEIRTMQRDIEGFAGWLGGREMLSPIIVVNPEPGCKVRLFCVKQTFHPILGVKTMHLRVHSPSNHVSVVVEGCQSY